MEKLITVLTATYNRAHLLPDLYQSLCRQTCQLFDWVIVDDGSTDNTEKLIVNWISMPHQFQIEYIKKENGGKNRAINDGVKLVNTPYTMIVDSDDYLTDDAIDFLTNVSDSVLKENKIAGVAGLRGTDINTPIKIPLVPPNEYITASNLERRAYNLESDACEVYKTDILLSHPFFVWPHEKYLPEEVVWNQLALEGYCLRWYNRVTCIVRYQQGGITRESWLVLRNNPMNYAMMFNHHLLTCSSIKSQFYNALQFVSCCFLGKEPGYILNCNNKLLAIILFFPGWLLSKRRLLQIKCYCLN